VNVNGVDAKEPHDACFCSCLHEPRVEVNAKPFGK
jgi:hypothetical protein